MRTKSREEKRATHWEEGGAACMQKRIECAREREQKRSSDQEPPANETKTRPLDPSSTSKATAP